jgi:hypothetical protein
MLSFFQTWQVFVDLVVPCAPIPSKEFGVAVGEGFVHAENTTFVADPGNAVSVANFWEGMRLISASQATGNLSEATAETRAALVSNAGAISTRIAPLAVNSANFTTPGEISKTIQGYSMWSNGSISSAIATQQPDIFPPGSFCALGQGADFISAVNQIGAENLATTNAAYGINAALFVLFALM